MEDKHVPTRDPDTGIPRAMTGNLELFAPIRWVIHLLYWPLYLLFGVPVQLGVRTRNYVLRNPAFGRTIINFFGLFRYLVFFTNWNRAVLFLRASWILTPSNVLSFMPGENVISEDPSVNAGPYPDNWSELQGDVLRRDDYTCTCCGNQGGPHGNTELHADHVVPRSREGADAIENLRTLCRSCHQARHARFFPKTDASQEDGVI